MAQPTEEMPLDRVLWPRTSQSLHSVCMFIFGISKSWLQFPHLLDYKIFLHGILTCIRDGLWETSLNYRETYKGFPDYFSSWSTGSHMGPYCVSCSTVYNALSFSVEDRAFPPHPRHELLIWMCCLMFLGSGRKILSTLLCLLLRLAVFSFPYLFLGIEFCSSQLHL